jgi:hypothetical protein
MSKTEKRWKPKYNRSRKNIDKRVRQWTRVELQHRRKRVGMVFGTEAKKTSLARESLRLDGDGDDEVEKSGVR